MNDTGGAGAEGAPDAQPPAPGPPARARSLQMGVRGGRKGAFRLHHSTTFFFRCSHADQTPLFVLALLDSANSANGGSEGTKSSVSCAPQHHFFFLRSHAGGTHLFLLEIMDSANFGFRPLKSFFRSIIFFDPLIVTAF